MSNINTNMAVTIKGVLSIDSDGKIIMSVEDVGDVELDCVLKEFDERAVTLSVRCDANYPAFVGK